MPAVFHPEAATTSSFSEPQGRPGSGLPGFMSCTCGALGTRDNRVEDQEVTMEIQGFVGEVLEPSDEGYETARAIWNGDIQRRPAVIARCTGAADVIAAVRLARERELPVAGRGGGA